MFLPFLPASSVLAARALNSLLHAEPWARDRLVPHAGKSVCFQAGRMQLVFLVQATGHIIAADHLSTFSVQLVLPANQTGAALRLLGTGQASELANLMHVQGDAGLANVVSGLAADLRPDIEHALAARIGDIPAVRVMALGRTLFSGARQAFGRLQGNLAEFAAHESGLLANQGVLHDFATDLQAVQARLDTLEQRVARLSRGAASGQPFTPTGDLA